MRLLESHFVVTSRRKVSRDNVVMVRGIGYEMPAGYDGRKVDVYDHTLERRLTVIHEGKHVRILPVDLAANARAERRRRVEKERPAGPGPIKTAAQLLYERDHKTIVTSGGDYYEKDK